MAYTALPDMRVPYDNDGTIVYFGGSTAGATSLLSGATLIELNDHDQSLAFNSETTYGYGNQNHRLFYFFPEQREITAYYAFVAARGLGTVTMTSSAVQGSNDTGNGSDGTWETASLPSGAPAGVTGGNSTSRTFDEWRTGIKPISFTGPKKNIRLEFVNTSTSASSGIDFRQVQLYGEAAAGQMLHDLVYINHDDTPGVAFQAPEDFGDMPLGTTVVRQFRVKNVSATKTATNVNIQCNDADFAISTDGVTWVVTINIASLGPGVESNTLYVRCTTPAPGAALAPRFARIVTTCDAGFFG